MATNPNNSVKRYFFVFVKKSAWFRVGVAEWRSGWRAGLITQRSKDQNLVLLYNRFLPKKSTPSSVVFEKI